MSSPETPAFDRASMTAKWQSQRDEKKVYQTDESSNRPKYYALDMFPYPSGAGLHVGHPKGYIATDVISRKKHLEGYNVLHPMGFDSFGLPTENYAMKNKIHPSKATDDNVAIFIEQLKKIGFNYDRDRMVSTADPEFYKRTQRQFLQMYHHYFDHAEQKAKPIDELRTILKAEELKGGKAEGLKEESEIKNFQNRYQTQTKSDPQFFASLSEEDKIEYYLDTQKRLAFVSTAPINRCPSCMTALANEDLEGNNCERCGSTIERKRMRQWMIRITDYAQRLLDGLDILPERQDHIKAMQRHWIGKSEGTTVEFGMVNSEGGIKVYTTRIDTVFGVTYVAIAPEYPEIEQFVTDEQRDAVLAYIEASKNKTDLQRQESQEKTGVRTGSYVINPFTNEQVPLRVADYVLMDYGTGAVMAVPAHDERDWEFAHKYNLPIKEVVAKEYGQEPHPEEITVPGVTCVLFDPTTQKYGCIHYTSNPGEYRLISGGAKEGEDFIDVAKRELLEETGYCDIQDIVPITSMLYSRYFNPLKKRHFRGEVRPYLIVLNSLENKGTSLEDHEKGCEPVWVDAQEIINSLESTGDVRFGKGNYDHRIYIVKKAVHNAVAGGYDTSSRLEDFALEAMTAKGILINSGEFSDMTSEQAIAAMQARLTEHRLGGKKTNYRLNDWVFSRQRYRGEPIPFVYKEAKSNNSQFTIHNSPLLCLGSFKGSNLILNPEKQAELMIQHEHTEDGAIHLVGCIVKDAQGCRYVHQDAKANEFYLPGGKVDKGESMTQAAVRELREELGIEVSDVTEIGCRKHIHNGIKRCFHVMEVNTYTGTPVNNDAHKYDQYRVEIIDADNILGRAVKINGTITDDDYDIRHTFVDIHNIKTHQGLMIGDGMVEDYDDSLIDPSGLYYQYYDAGQKKYFFTTYYMGAEASEEQSSQQSHNRIRVTPMNESELPLTLPDVAHYEPTGTEEGPLAKIDSWINTTLEDGTPARRESNTMPGWAGSSRYWLRYMDPHNASAMVGPDREQYRGQVDLYVGGMEHACRHLIYARFRHKFLKDIGVVSTEEPFKKLVGVGLVLAEDGRKMSKRRGNVINPDDVIAEFGTDAFRTYEMFMGPFGNEVARSTAGVKGVRRFLDKVVKLSHTVTTVDSTTVSSSYKKSISLLHKTIKKVTEDVDNFSFNTAVSALMIYVNHLEEVSSLVKGGEGGSVIPKELFEPLIQLLAPFAPHLAEELRAKMGHTDMIFAARGWPQYDEALMVDDVITLAIQINGKMRGTIEVSPSASQDEVMTAIRVDEKLAAHLTSDIKKIIYVPAKICNIVL